MAVATRELTRQEEYSLAKQWLTQLGFSEVVENGRRLLRRSTLHAIDPAVLWVQKAPLAYLDKLFDAAIADGVLTNKQKTAWDRLDSPAYAEVEYTKEAPTIRERETLVPTDPKLAEFYRRGTDPRYE